ncbi:MAG TPA: YebC/PmpR family DNA-binding transcriptional regulator [Bryobacteraceae bacterium]|nr:YebC/PmpR family DNA-binding transcriptional regulator [Bryobacteraceae bacterium]
MSGHSKWAQIKRQKGVTDSRRGQLFTKLGREITIAARQGGGDPDANFRLRLAVQRARDANMPSDTIDRAVKRGSGDSDAADLQEITYEGYGPGGTAILVDVLTDNRNRTAAELRATFTRAGGSLGEPGSVAWQFESRGVITVNANGAEAETVELAAIDAGAEDVKSEDGVVEIITGASDLEAVRRALVDNNLPVASAEPSMIAKTTVDLGDHEAEQVLRLLDRLEELDDVQQVHSNAEFSDAVLAGLQE